MKHISKKEKIIIGSSIILLLAIIFLIIYFVYLEPKQHKISYSSSQIIPHSSSVHVPHSSSPSSCSSLLPPTSQIMNLSRQTLTIASLGQFEIPKTSSNIPKWSLTFTYKIPKLKICGSNLNNKYMRDRSSHPVLYMYGEVVLQNMFNVTPGQPYTDMQLSSSAINIGGGYGETTSAQQKSKNYTGTPIGDATDPLSFKYTGPFINAQNYWSNFSGLHTGIFVSPQLKHVKEGDILINTISYNPTSGKVTTSIKKKNRLLQSVSTTNIFPDLSNETNITLNVKKSSGTQIMIQNNWKEFFESIPYPIKFEKRNVQQQYGVFYADFVIEPYSIHSIGKCPFQPNYEFGLIDVSLNVVGSSPQSAKSWPISEENLSCMRKLSSREVN